MYVGKTDYLAICGQALRFPSLKRVQQTTDQVETTPLRKIKRKTVGYFEENLRTYEMGLIKIQENIMTWIIVTRIM